MQQIWVLQHHLLDTAKIEWDWALKEVNAEDGNTSNYGWRQIEKQPGLKVETDSQAYKPP